jgi:hypothetical protein
MAYASIFRLSIPQLNRTITPTGAPAGSKQIKEVIVRSGSAFVRAQDLTKLLRSHINNDKLTDLAVETSGSEIKISGHLKKTLSVHFEVKGRSA